MIAIKHKLTFPLAALLLIGLVGQVGMRPSHAQDVITVTAEATASIAAGRTQRARAQAIKAAERAAVVKALAPGISVETLLVNLRLSGSIVGAIPFGKVVTKKILEEGVVNARQGASGQGGSYRVRIKADVKRETSGGDPSFYIDAGINQSVFKDGEELEISVQSTKPCYVAIFNILEDKKIIRLLPNYLSKKNFLAGNKKLAFPGAKDRKEGIRLKVHLPDGKETTTEYIYLLALTRPFELKSANIQEGIFGVFNGQTAFMEDLIQEVVAIPLGSRAEALVPYEIKKTKKGI